MPTIKDIAKLAKVSQGTVSNVLNGYPGVSVEKMKAVLNAVKELGYQQNSQAKQLRKNSKISNIIAIIIPNIDEQRYSEFYTVIKNHFESQNRLVFLFTSADTPYKEIQILQHLATLRPSHIFTISCLEKDGDIYKILKKQGSIITFIDRITPYAENYVTFDYATCGHEIALAIVKSRPKKVCLFTGPYIFPNGTRFIKELTKILDQHHIIHRIIYANSSISYQAAFDLIQNESPDIVITTNPYHSRSLSVAINATGRTNCIVYSFTYQMPINRNSGETDYYFNYGNLATEAIGIVEEKENQNFENQKKVIPADGFLLPKSLYVSPTLQSLNILTSVSDATDALIQMSDDFTRRTNIKLNIVTMSPNEFDNTLFNIESGIAKHFDIFRLGRPNQNQSLLKYLKPIDPIFHKEITKEMFPEVVSTLSYINNELYLVPFDIGTQIIVYRKDLFEDVVIKRQYYETYNQQLRIPDTFEELNQIAEFFTSSINPSSPVSFSTELPFGTNISVFANFILRYDYYAELEGTGGIYFKEEIIRKAVQNLIEYSNYTRNVYDSDRIQPSIDNFINGELAMMFLHSNHSSHLMKITKNVLDERIGFHCVPGGSSILGGSSFAISHMCKDIKLAYSFFQWICDKEQTFLFSLLGGSSPNKSVYTDTRIVNHFPWHKQFAENPFNKNSTILYQKYSIEKLSSIISLAIKSAVNRIISIDECTIEIYSNLKDCLSESIYGEAFKQ